MSDGPNYEKVFRGMQCLNGLINQEDRAIIKRFLRFYTDQPDFEMFINHYSKLLPQEDLAEFGIKETPVEEVVEESTVGTEETTEVVTKKKKTTKAK